MFEGSFVATVTPFLNNEVDFDTLGRLIDFQIENSTHGIVPCGTTGESATLSEEEHTGVVEFTVKHVAARVKVIAGTGSNSTDTALKLTRHALEAGADAALIITPYYNKPTQSGLYAHFAAIAGAVDIPIILYNVPGRTGINMLPETVGRLAHDFSNIVGLKDATGNLVQASQTLAAVGEREFDLLSGEDALVFPLLAIGGKGVISVLTNIAPRSMSDLVNKFHQGDIAGSRELHYRQLPLCQALFYETNPIPVKTALELLGKGNGQLRLPLSPMHEEAKGRLKEAMSAFGLL